MAGIGFDFVQCDAGDAAIYAMAGKRAKAQGGDRKTCGWPLLERTVMP